MIPFLEIMAAKKAKMDQAAPEPAMEQKKAVSTLVMVDPLLILKKKKL